MTITIDIPEELAERLGDRVASLPREGLALARSAKVFGPKQNSVDSSASPV
jgi:hypothetical protein